MARILLTGLETTIADELTKGIASTGTKTCTPQPRLLTLLSPETWN